MRNYNILYLSILIVLFGLILYPTIAQRHYCYLSIKIDKVYAYYPNNQTNPIVKKDRSELVNQFGSDNIFAQDVKQCICNGFEDQYCFNVNEVDVCSVAPSEPTYCYKRPSVYRSFLNLLWMPGVFIMIVAFVMPFATVIGRNATEYIISPCFPCFRRKRITTMIQREMAAIEESFGSFGREDGMVEQTVLKLKTKTVKDKEDEGSTSDEDICCMICMAPFEEGQKIGDLSCKHSFHVHCLKEWLTRRNACPLCNAQVADPHRVLVEREDSFTDNPAGEVDEDTRNRFDRLINFYHRRTLTRMQSSIN